jgi:hypothetical protein
MKLHWSFTNLIVGTVAIAMLSATPALAVDKPFPCLDVLPGKGAMHAPAELLDCLC